MTTKNLKDTLHPADGDFPSLFLAHQPRIYAFILTLVPNRTDAEDLLQETGLVLFRQAHKFRPDTNFFAWACQIAYHKVLDFRKRQARSPLHFDSDFVELVAAEQLGQVESAANRHTALKRCLEKLTSKDRALIESCYRSGVTINSVANELRQPANAIYKSLRRIRGVLFDCVTRSIALEGHP